MLAQLGSVIFEVLPVGLDGIDHSGTASFARHPVLGEMPPLEFTGEGSETWRLHGELRPEFSARNLGDSGLSGIDELHAMRRAGQAVFLMRGDGVPMGWVVITHVSERSRRLMANGVGRVVEFEVDVARAKFSGADLSAYSGDPVVAADAATGGTTTNVLPGGAPLGQGGVGHA